MGPLSKRLRTDLQQILSGHRFKERAERLENQLKDLSFNFHHDFTKKIVQFAEQTNVKITYLFLSLVRQNCNVVQSFSSSEFLERIFSSLHFFITTNTILGGAVASWLVRSTPEQAFRFEPWPGTLCYVLGQDTLLSQCLSPPACINGYRRT